MIYLGLRCARCHVYMDLELAAGQEIKGFVCSNRNCHSTELLLEAFQLTGDRIIARTIFDLELRVKNLERAACGRETEAAGQH